MGDAFPILEFLIALLIGGLVGLEREKQTEAGSELGIGGVRTFALFSLTGGVAAWLSTLLGSKWVFVGFGLCVTATVIAGYVMTARADDTETGMTTEIAALVVYLLGGVTLFGHTGLAAALAIITSVVLAFKRPIHSLIDRLNRTDLHAGLKLLFASFIVLPVLPEEPMDPWGALNPYTMWLLVILISGLSLVGYIASRVLGSRRGTALTGFFGGLASSTAVSLDFARRSRTEGTSPLAANAFAAGLMLSWFMMFVRVIIGVSVVHASLLSGLLAPMTAMGLTTLILAIIHYRRSRGSQPPEARELPLKNPFSLISAIKFAAFFAAVLLVVKIVQGRTQGAGLYGVAALAGLSDVDAIALSMADFAKRGGQASVAVHAITIAVLTNTLVKCGIVATLGTPALRRRTMIATALVLAVGLIALWAG